MRSPPSNICAFTWMRGHPNRLANATMDGRIELFRNGDWSIATNGVAEYHERVLPFAHDGYGQDAEWVAANFTNAEEILSVGYANWVDSQVGTGLTNGLYKFTVTFTNTPPEATLLTVGDYVVAVTNGIRRLMHGIAESNRFAQVAVDFHLCREWPGYANSSNRLRHVTSALEHPMSDWITNRLASVQRQLQSATNLVELSVSDFLSSDE